MSRAGKLILTAVLAVPVAAIGVAAFTAERTEAKSYSFPRVVIDATIRPDGTLSLVERRTFDFTGPFTFAFFTIESVHAPPENIQNFTIRDGGQVLQHSPEVAAGNFKATWYFDARDERKTFTISYDVPCAVDVYSDGAHLLWQFVGRGWTETTDLVRIAVHVPPEAPGRVTRPASCPAPAGRAPSRVRPLETGDVRAWGHGPLNGQVTIPEPDTVVLTVRDVRPGQFVEGSIVFPAGSVPLAARADGGSAAAVLAEERRLADEANALRRQHDLETALVKVLFFAVPLAMLGLIILARRRDRVPGLPRLLQEPPSDIHPVDLALLWSASRKRPSPKTAYRTQFLHLARTGTIELQPVGSIADPDDFVVRLRKPPEQGIDQEFVEFLFGDDGDRPVSLKEVKHRGTRKERLQEWWSGVGRKNKPRITRMVKGRSRAESTAATVLAIGAGIYGYWRSIGFEEDNFAFQGLVGPLALWLIPVAVVSWLVALRLMPLRLPPKERQRVARWKAFRRFLKEFSSLDDAPVLAVIVWERYLVYAVALGVAEEVEDQVRALVPADQLPEPWPGAPAGDAGFRSYHHWRASSSSFAPASAATAVGWTGGWGSSSGGGGGGGGFSGGGGGGGGGTGGGAG